MEDDRVSAHSSYADEEQTDIDINDQAEVIEDQAYEDEDDSDIDSGEELKENTYINKQPSAILDKPGGNVSHPRITKNFHPELSGRKSGRASQRSTTFSRQSSGNDSFITTRRRTYDGREITLVTLDTQTDWEWVEEALNNISTSEDLPLSLETKSSPLVPEIREPPVVSETSRKMSSGAKTELTDPSLDTISQKSPFTVPYNDEYGIPLLDVTSSEDDSSDDDIGQTNNDDRNLLPSIGPPQILQYIRESELEDPEIISPEEKETELADGVEEPLVDQDGRYVGMYGGHCEFCHKDIKPFPTVEQQERCPPEELYCCEQYHDFVQFATTTAMELEEKTKRKKKKINIKPHAHFGSKKARKAAKERAVQRMRDRELQRRQQEASSLQNFYSASSPSADVSPGTSKTDINVGVQGSSIAPLVTNRGNQFRGGGPQISYKDMAAPNASQTVLSRVSSTVQVTEVARQMKTINYQLSSQKCFEEGWTIRPTTPLLDDGDLNDVFIPEMLNFTHRGKIGKQELMQKYYEDGKKFLTVFPDGTGNVFYPSGVLALAICKIDVGQFMYVLHENNTESSKVVGVFDPNGYGCCYHDNGVVRLYYDQLDGLELDRNGRKKKKWSWKDQHTHVHAPPFQPICIGFNRHIGLRVMAQDNITLTFTARNRSCRFNMGAKLKLVAPENIKPKEVSDNYIFMEERTAAIEALLHKVSNVLRFPNSPKIDKILPPIHVTNKMNKVEELRSKKKGSRSVKPSIEKFNTLSNPSLPTVSVN